MMKYFFTFIVFLTALSATTWFLSSHEQELARLFQPPTQQSRHVPTPLFYQTVGKFPDLEERPLLSSPPTQFTLELALCEDKPCVNQTLEQLEKKSIEAYFTPLNNQGRVVFRIRHGIFASAATAEAAKHSLSQKNVVSSVVEL
ncbi:MAG: hypothetical protein HYW48_06510 [Deltaproteobacteria bacterium]|nr:hypothetical protein [Deltaproteobacteria bacterium]